MNGSDVPEFYRLLRGHQCMSAMAHLLAAARSSGIPDPSAETFGDEMWFTWDLDGGVVVAVVSGPGGGSVISLTAFRGDEPDVFDIDMADPLASLLLVRFVSTYMED